MQAPAQAALANGPQTIVVTVLVALSGITGVAIWDPFGFRTPEIPLEQIKIFASTAVTVTVEEGTGTSLPCVVQTNIGLPDVVHWKDSSGDMMVSWRNGVPGSEHQNGRFTAGTGNTLVIEAVRKSDAGRYTCSVVHGGNVFAANSTQLNVENGIVNTKSEVKANEGYAVTMPCSFPGEATKVTWRRQHPIITIKSSDVIEWQRSGSHGNKAGACFADGWCDITKDFSLVITPAIEYDDATYICAVSYYQGHEISGSTKLIVEGATITTESTIKVENGSSVQLPCTYEAKPFEVCWTKDSNDLARWRNGKKDGGACFDTGACDMDAYSKLTIYHAKESDGGRYTCRVKYRKEHEKPVEGYTDLSVNVKPGLKEPVEKGLPGWFMPWFLSMFALSLVIAFGALIS